MLWEHNSTIVVMLTKLREMGRVRQRLTCMVEVCFYATTIKWTTISHILCKSVPYGRKLKEVTFVVCHKASDKTIIELFAPHTNLCVVAK